MAKAVGAVVDFMDGLLTDFAAGRRPSDAQARVGTLAFYRWGGESPMAAAGAFASMAPEARRAPGSLMHACAVCAYLGAASSLGQGEPWSLGWSRHEDIGHDARPISFLQSRVSPDKEAIDRAFGRMSSALSLSAWDERAVLMDHVYALARDWEAATEDCAGEADMERERARHFAGSFHLRIGGNASGAYPLSCDDSMARRMALAIEPFLLSEELGQTVRTPAASKAVPRL